jgi:beta-phosphoglucomutase-like phosphatase (HAD superfamily)
MSFPKAVLWDMDGVLADTNQLHFETWEHVLLEQGIPFDRLKFHRIYGLKNRDILPLLVGRPLEPAWMDWISDQKEIAYRKFLPGIPALPGVQIGYAVFNPGVGNRQWLPLRRQRMSKPWWIF